MEWDIRNWQVSGSKMFNNLIMKVNIQMYYRCNEINIFTLLEIWRMHELTIYYPITGERRQTEHFRHAIYKQNNQADGRMSKATSFKDGIDSC